MRSVIGLLCVALVGCSARKAETPKEPSRDAKLGKLEPAEIAFTHYTPTEASEESGLGPGVLFTMSIPKGSNEIPWVSISPAIQCRVGHDPGFYVDDMDGKPARKLEPPHILSGVRMVSVVVLEGTHKGLEGTIVRDDLRPFPKP
jgi:hypothetical protein